MDKWELKDLIGIIDVDTKIQVVDKKGIEIIFMDSMNELPYILAYRKVLAISAGTDAFIKIVVAD